MTVRDIKVFVFETIKKSWQAFSALALLGFVLVSVVTLFFLASGIKNQTNWIQQSYALRLNVNKIAFLVLQMENSQRNYVLDKKQEYLDKCYEAVVTLEKTLTRIHSFINSDIKMSEHFNQINALIDEAQLATDDFLKLTSSDNKAAAYIYDTQAADRVMATLDSMIRRFNEIEDEHLIQRIDQIEKKRVYLTVVFILALFSIFTLFIILLIQKLRHIHFLNEGRESLLLQNEELEQLVKERTAEVNVARELAEHERNRVELLLQDCNHRIGNSLAQVSSLLNIQLRRIDEPKAADAIGAARDRLQTVAIAHHRLRLGEDMETASVKEFLQAVVSDILENSDRKNSVKIECDITDMDINARDVTTLGIILGELITNSMKHGFKDGRKGLIRVVLHPDSDGVLFLSVKDDGVGITKDTASSKVVGLGMMVIKQLCLQFGGEPQYCRSKDGGTDFIVSLPLLKTKE